MHTRSNNNKNNQCLEQEVPKKLSDLTSKSN